MRRVELLAVMAALSLAACGGSSSNDGGGQSQQDATGSDEGGGGDATGGEDTSGGEDTTGGTDTTGGEEVVQGEVSCAAYCKAVTAACTGANAQYPDEATCTAYCTTLAKLPAGAAGDKTGNSIACRMTAAEAAALKPDVLCAAAGPASDGTCGTPCDTYCHVAAANCTGDNALFADTAACQEACAKFPTNGKAGDTSGDSLQCRVYHVAVAATDAATHCAHAGVDGGGVCVCTPDCTGKVCGDDGCGGTCGSCDAGKACDATGQCVESACGQCYPDTTCGADGSHDQWCAGDGCGDITFEGQCDGSIVVFCDSDDKLKSIDCGFLSDGNTCGFSEENGFYDCVSKPCDPACAEDEVCVAGECKKASCAGVCGGQSETGCYCDEACTESGDCCPDFQAECCGCDGKVCGTTACGEACGECGESEYCSEDMTECKACTCDGKSCGMNECGESCGDCGAGQACVDFQCVAATCAGACGAAEKTAAGCYCDTECFNFGDCCPDVCDVCSADLATECADCAKSCEGKECGKSSCGSSCGECSGEGQVCSDEGKCCTPACDGKQCGDDGCGGSCGDCGEGQECSAESQCVDLPPTCAEYCTAIMANCTGDNAQFADQTACIDYCVDNGIPKGTKADTSGDTVGCRLYHAGAAKDEPATHCPHAGPSGGDVCGTWCDVYCDLVQHNCTGDNAVYADAAACATACAAFNAEGQPGATSGDNVQCRIYHAGAAGKAGAAATHCPHTAPDGGGVCVNPTP